MTTAVQFLIFITLSILMFSSAHGADGQESFSGQSKRDPCSDLNCEHFCVTKKGKQATCVCHRGYKIQQNGYSCKEINECKERRNLCGNGTCHNIAGSYFCSCKYGYYFDRPAGTCRDVNECAVSSKICGPGECVNKPGLYECNCYEGYYFNQKTWYCEAELYECDDKIHSCRVNSLCLDLYGDFRCRLLKCPNAFYVRKNTNLCVLQCPVHDERCKQIKAQTIKFLSRSYRKSIPANQTQFVYWYATEKEADHMIKKTYTLTGNGYGDFTVQHLEDKYIRITNPRAINDPKSYKLDLHVDTIENDLERRNTYILYISISK